MWQSKISMDLINTIDEVLFSIAKADGVPGGMDNGEHVNIEEQISSQREEATQDGREEEP